MLGYILKIKNKFAKFFSHLAIETTSEITSFLNFWFWIPLFGEIPPVKNGLPMIYLGFFPRLNLWMWGSGQICFMTNKLIFENLAPWSDKNSSVRSKFPKPKCRYLIDSGPKRKLAVFCRRNPAGGWTSPKRRKGPLSGLMGHSFAPLFEHTRAHIDIANYIKSWPAGL